MASDLQSSVALAIAIAARQGDRDTVVKLLTACVVCDGSDAMTFADGQTKKGWGSSMFGKLASWLTGRKQAEADHAKEHERQRQAFEPEPELPLADEMTPTEIAVYDGELIFATSSNVHQWRYDGKNRKLYCQFKSGGVYRVADFPFDGPMGSGSAMGFYRSDSPGRYWWQHIRDKFDIKMIGTMPAEKYHNVVRTIS